MTAWEKDLLNILYEDEDIIVCIKPAGTASETKKAGQQDMASLIRNYRNEKKEVPYAGLVHRLDQPVEGILVFGKNQKSTAALSRQLAGKDFTKNYLAVVEGNLPAEEGRLENYLKKDGRKNLSFPVSEGEAGAKKAVLFYRVLETDPGAGPAQSLVKIRLITGRHHQIRVQMAQIGAPVAGDRKYGRQKKDAGGGEQGALCRDVHNAAGPGEYGLGLCACELEFRHPKTKKEMKFSIRPSQPVFQKFLPE